MRTVLLLALAATLANAASISWTGYGNDHQWTNKINWSPDTVPGQNDDVTIPKGTVYVTVETGVNSLVMGTQVEAPANLTLFKAFVVGNGGMTVQENGNLIINSGLEMILGSVTMGGSLYFIDGVVSGAWTIAPRAMADLGNENEKGFSGATFVSQGSLKIGGVITLNGSSTITLESATSANSNLYIQNGDGSSVDFDASAATFTYSTGTLQVQAPVSLGKFVLQSGNVSILDSLTFTESLAIPSGSYVTSAGNAVLNVSAGATGSGVLSLAGAKSYLYGIDMSGYVNALGGDVIFYAASSMHALTVDGGNLVTLKEITPAQLNLLAGTTSGAGALQAAQVLVSTTGLTLGSAVVVGDSLTLEQSVLTFGTDSSVTVTSNATASVQGATMLTGAPNGKGVTNNGKLQVQKELQLQNIPISGSGSTSIASSLSASSVSISQSTVTLSSGASFAGQTTWLTIGAIKSASGGAVSGVVGSYHFQCPGECDHVTTPDVKTPPAPFTFTA